MTVERTAVTTVACLMALAARTAPKAKGVDTILVHVSEGKELARLAKVMTAFGASHKLAFFLRDAKNITASDACVFVGVKGCVAAGVNCGACGFLTCAGLEKATKKQKRRTTPFAGPNCAIRMTDLGIAIGSAVKTAQIHNVDNRVMYTAGTAAIELGLLGDECTVAYGIPLSVTGKSIYFDRQA
ncbi:MAG: DUF2148 domain-containing protein [Methanoregula sp.]|nr:DUF2148 domain-containing protein [Methanoregula sp.]